MSGNSSNSRQKTKTLYVGIPAFVANSADYVNVSPIAKELLGLIVQQYNWHNNGNLTATWKDYEDALQCSSENTFTKALTQLRDSGLLIATGTGTTSRRGGRAPILYALAWAEINVIFVDGEKSKGHHIKPPRGAASWVEDESRTRLREKGLIRKR
ncbi:MAG: hypothetical protein ACK5NL_09445 [Vibrio fluvialis]